MSSIQTTRVGRATRCGWAFAFAYGVLVVSACGERAATDGPLPTPSPAVVIPAIKSTPPPPLPPSAVPAPVAHPVEPTVALVRVAMVEGTPQQNGLAVTVGARISDGATLRLAVGDKLSLDVAQSGRVVVEGPATLQLGTDAPAQLLAAEGVLTVIVPPAGDGILIPQRLATRLASLSFRPGTTSALAIHANGELLVNVIDGAAEVSATDVSAADAPVVALNPGAAQRFDARGMTPLKPAEDLNDALVKARKFVSAKSKAASAARAVTVESTRAALDVARAAIEAETAQGAQVTTRHKQAVATGSAEERATLLRELSAHGQRLFRLRRSLLARWEQAQVAVLALSAESREAAALSLTEIRPRIVALLPH